MAEDRSETRLGGTLGDVGEFAMISKIVDKLPEHPDVLVGPGDDAAVVSFAGPVLITTDTLVEGVHFRRDWASAEQIGRKAAAVNLTDIEAMGGSPKALVVAFSAPKELPAQWARDAMRGLVEEAAMCGATLVGGDTTGGREVTITVTVLGESEGEPVTRTGARPGQVVALVGRTGWAAGGLAVLGKGFSAPRDLVSAYQRPQPPYGEGVVAARSGASAMIDISDGLLADLGHVAAASCVAIDVDPGAFADLPEPFQRLAAATGVDPLALMLTGGEDQALAACFDADRVPEGWRIIGIVSEGCGVTVGGQPWEGTTGWAHFGPGRR